MRSLSQAEFERLIEGAKVLERQDDSLSALRSPDGNIIKIWQRQGLLSSDRLRPYSRRFADNCARLIARGIAAPVISDRFRIAETGEHVLLYPLLPGISLRELAADGRLPVDELADFYASLHQKGVLFRSIHLGNVLQLDAGGFGLIDVTDCWFFRRPVGMKHRALNIGYAWSYHGDHVYFDAPVRERMLRRYLDRAGLGAPQQRQLERHLQEAMAYYSARRARNKNRE